MLISKYSVVIAAFFVFIQINLPAQIPDDVFLKYSEFEDAQIKKSQKILQQAEQSFAEAKALIQTIPKTDSMVRKPENKKIQVQAIKKINEASGYYRMSTEILMDLFNARSTVFFRDQKKVEHYATGLEKAKYMERQANKYINQANMIRSEMEEADRYREALNLSSEARVLEKEALEYMGRSCQIYQDFPVEYDYHWENDVDPNVILASKSWVLNNQPLNVVEIKEQPKPQQEGKDTVILFRVQIAAHTVPLTEEYLRTIYQGSKTIIMIREDEWYKYQIGAFSSFAEAELELKKANVERAFVVAYWNGKKISTREARDIAP